MWCYLHSNHSGPSQFRIHFSPVNSVHFPDWFTHFHWCMAFFRAQCGVVHCQLWPDLGRDNVRDEVLGTTRIPRARDCKERCITGETRLHSKCLPRCQWMWRCYVTPKTKTVLDTWPKTVIFYYLFCISVARSTSTMICISTQSKLFNRTC